MKKKIAVLVYPEFSLQEIGNTIALFRWYFDSPTVLFSTSLQPVRSEEGILVIPEKTVDDFDIDLYDCLILPGVSDVRESLKNRKLIQFLKSFTNHPDFFIGAIGGGPIFLSMAGLLDDKKFTNQLYVEMNEKLPFINDKNIQYKPIVIDENIVTAIGDAYKEFPIVLAKLLGYDCKDDVYFGNIRLDSKGEVPKHHLDDEGLKEFNKVFSDFL